ncbi:centromere binding protein b [Ophiostoma piceae UAMH 11346]|uniref:Centromere binding protein b n=1 Tax=Ophiostoma piceae (strain UAMH 11346) TaxID=1262450 RepID=S3BW20_OPHP1|nr:centromere binding protein b [Ophiostoma piceae UAMH 11346]
MSEGSPVDSPAPATQDDAHNKADDDDQEMEDVDPDQDEDADLEEDEDDLDEDADQGNAKAAPRAQGAEDAEQAPQPQLEKTTEAEAAARHDTSIAPQIEQIDQSQRPPAPSSALSTPQKERHSLTLDQRRALRRWANAQLSRPSHKQCIEWFQHQYNQTISQSTVSHSLSPKYARLDGEPQLSGSRLRFGNWPEVEKLVLLWYQQMAHAGRLPTNDELGEKAKSIFSQLPRHRGEEPPEFSPGWIHRFKKRYGLLIRRQRRQSLSGSQNPQNTAGGEPASDVVYLMDAVQGIMTVTSDTRPAAIRETVIRVLGIEPSLAVCERHALRQLQHDDAVVAEAQAAAVPRPLSASSSSTSSSTSNHSSQRRQSLPLK